MAFKAKVNALNAESKIIVRYSLRKKQKKKGVSQMERYKTIILKCS